LTFFRNLFKILIAMKVRFTAILAFLFLIGMVACSDNDNPAQSRPYQRLSGKVAISNGSNVPIVVVQYTQTRGDQQITIHLGSTLFPGYSVYLRNALDNNDSQIFAGGDRVQVEFRAAAPDPEDPGHPLFQNTVELTVNGSQMIHVKDGGDYGISPG